MIADHYETLGVERGATADEIRAAARRAASQAHPDREGGSHERMQAVNKARDVLLDPERRKRYDAGQGDAQPPSIEQRARATLVQMFDAALDDEQDPGYAAHDALSHAKKQIDSQLAKIRRKVATLTAQKGRFKVKEGVENHVEALIQRKLAELDRETVSLNDAAAVHAEIRRLLTEYEREPTAEEVQQREVYVSPLGGIFGGGPFGAFSNFGGRP